MDTSGMAAARAATALPDAGQIFSRMPADRLVALSPLLVEARQPLTAVAVGSVTARTRLSDTRTSTCPGAMQGRQSTHRRAANHGGSLCQVLNGCGACTRVHKTGIYVFYCCVMFVLIRGINEKDIVRV